MTSHVLRLYALGVGLLVFFLLWVAVATRPWLPKPKVPQDPRLVALAAREKRLQHDAALVKAITERRFAVYRERLRQREAVIRRARAEYEQRLAAARLAAARAAAARSTTQAPVRVAPQAPSRGVASPTVPLPAAPPPPLVVTLPPEVQIVELPPITTTQTS